MRQAATRELFNYWNRLRAGRDAPERSEIDLAAIRGLLHDIFMLEVDAGHRFPFVMSGSRVNALFCAEQRSRSFLDLWPLREVHNIAAVLLTVVDAACPVIACAEARPESYAKADVEILLLPLHHNGHAQARILGLLATAAKPTWFGLLASEQLTLRSLRAIDDAVLPVLTPLGAKFSGPPRLEATAIRRHLRVFQGGK
jgi:hypothetical protein